MMKNQHRFRNWLAAAGIAAVVAASAACAGSTASKRTSAPPGGAATPGGSSAMDTSKSTTLGAAAPDGAGAQPETANGAYASSDAGRQDGGAQLPSLLDRKIIMVATVDLSVDDVARGFED
ncbi:MAG: hypothetical protein EPO22_01540, partial [Dehalococcoidia bacterium]